MVAPTKEVLIVLRFKNHLSLTTATPLTAKSIVSAAT